MILQEKNVAKNDPESLFSLTPGLTDGDPKIDVTLAFVEPSVLLAKNGAVIGENTTTTFL
jgi:hypothetical protein